MSVGKLLSAACLESRERHRELHQTWIRISITIGSRLPDSRLMLNVQRDGDVDMVLRCLEDELAGNESADEIDLLSNPLVPLVALSEYWIGSIYEIFRLLRERGSADQDNRFEAIFRNLELLRMSLEKHEIAKDRSVEEPIILVRYPPRDGDEEYRYVGGRSKADRQRAHIMPTGLSERGSIMWHAIDLKADESLWIERRSLSNEILSLWTPSGPPDVNTTG